MAIFSSSIVKGRFAHINHRKTFPEMVSLSRPPGEAAILWKILVYVEERSLGRSSSVLRIASSLTASQISSIWNLTQRNLGTQSASHSDEIHILGVLHLSSVLSQSVDHLVLQVGVTKLQFAVFDPLLDFRFHEAFDVRDYILWRYGN